MRYKAVQPILILIGSDPILHKILTSGNVDIFDVFSAPVGKTREVAIYGKIGLQLFLILTCAKPSA